MAIDLYSYQVDALRNMKNGSILCGGVGSGKSRVALAYYLLKDTKGCIKVNEWHDGVILPFSPWERFEPMKEPRDLYIITTAKKRDSGEWERELSNFAMWPDLEEPLTNAYGMKVTIDSWNNIKKYRAVHSAFFIFDEQRVVGSGAWVKAFLDIARKNHWILLSATPGDTWSDYIPVFVANGFFRNKTEFNAKHAVFARFSKYPKIEHYVYEEELERLRDSILVPMHDPRVTVRHPITIRVDYDKDKYRTVMRDHWDPYENCPIEETGKWVYLLRKVVNSDESRIQKLDEIVKDHPKLIIFYNFNYELAMLESYFIGIFYNYTCWNGHCHENCPEGDAWAYLVQYTAGCEGWNCITTDTVVFFSQNYSYKVTEQAAGRIDRINTPFVDLWYYYLRSTAPIDLGIRKALNEKRNFNEASFCRRGGH